MDLSRRKFLGMLGLAPAIPLIAPSKTYAFFGNILRPSRATGLPKQFIMTYLRVSVPGVSEPFFTTQPTQLVSFENVISIEDAIGKLGLKLPPDKEVEYAMHFEEMEGFKGSVLQNVDCLSGAAPTRAVVQVQQMTDWKEVGKLNQDFEGTKCAVGVRSKLKPIDFKWYTVDWQERKRLGLEASHAT